MGLLVKYLQDMNSIRSTGASVAETSFYPALINLMNGIGSVLKPKVRCMLHPHDKGSGIPDGALYAANQLQRGGADPIEGQKPERGVIEVKGAAADAYKVAREWQVKKYFDAYGQVLVTNYRDFILIGRDASGKQTQLEEYRLAENESDFWNAAAHPLVAEKKHGVSFEEFLKRVLLHAAPLADPKDVAWFLASYAREAKARIENSELAALSGVRKGLEEALGLKFEGEKGDHFFRSTFVQTLFYGIFSAWVLWSKDRTGKTKKLFNWHDAAWSLRVPMIRALFEQVATPSRLGPLGLVEVLDWASAALNRVEPTFFEKFEEAHAVQYFYEPFLEAFDPELRKELGVWYTPPEIVRYMVARVDTVLREELNIPDGLADKRVFVLDPCCGTGAFLVEVLHKIAETLKAKGQGDALFSQDLKQKALKHVFGFEILPAPFVVAHLQLGLLLRTLKAPLSDKKSERVGVYLTNSLTGWEPPKEPKSHLLFPELEDERNAADHIKQHAPILVILGNPPYNGYAGVAVQEERELSSSYRTTKKAAAPQGQGLNDLYVRFYRMAERRITEMNKPATGVACFISNYSWLDGLSFTGMREKFLEAFDTISIDCLNGDKYKTGKVTPEGNPDPSVFSTDFNREGIQVGTAIALMVRKEKHTASNQVSFRHFWGKSKLKDLESAAGVSKQKGYLPVSPVIKLGLSFQPTQTSEHYLNWPLLTELLPASFPGIQTGRDSFLIDVNEEKLKARISDYFNVSNSDERIRALYPTSMQSSQRFNPGEVRKQLLKRGIHLKNFFRHAYRPFDTRWLYWEPETKLLDEKREDSIPHYFKNNHWLALAQQNRREWDSPIYTTLHSARHLNERGANLFPMYLSSSLIAQNLFEAPTRDKVVPNLSEMAKKYLGDLKATSQECLFFHLLATLHSPEYRLQNAAALRQDWPRIPLPKSRKDLESSAELGRLLAGLHDPEMAVAGVTSGSIRPELKVLGSISKTGGGELNPDEDALAVTAGWGHAGVNGVCMPGRGDARARAYTSDERKTLEASAKALKLSPEQIIAALGDTCFDVYLNGSAFWRCVPERVWEYTLGGYQVLKKWLSYREKELLGRDLTLDEVRLVTEIVRRIAAILLMGPALSENYAKASKS